MKRDKGKWFGKLHIWKWGLNFNEGGRYFVLAVNLHNLLLYVWVCGTKLVIYKTKERKK